MCKKEEKNTEEGRKKEKRKKSSLTDKNAIYKHRVSSANKKIQLQGNTMHGRFMQFLLFFLDCIS